MKLLLCGKYVHVRYVFIFFALILYFLMQFGLKGMLSSTAGSDTGTVERLAESAEFAGGSYAMTALLYSLFPESLRMPFVYFTGTVFIIYCLRGRLSVTNMAFVLFLLLAPMMMSIGTFQKDMVLAWFIVPLAYCFDRLDSLSYKRAIFLTMVVYLLYAVSFRMYFLVILVVALFLFSFFVSKGYVRILLVMVGLVVGLLIPIDLLYDLQSPRDVANINRIFVYGREGARTAFMNPLEIDGWFNFIGNYFYSYWMIDLSIVSRFGLKEVYLFLNIVVYYYVALSKLLSRSKLDVFVATLILSHVLVLHLFEPDSGSYLRHLSSTLPYLVFLISRANSNGEISREYRV